MKFSFINSFKFKISRSEKVIIIIASFIVLYQMKLLKFQDIFLKLWDYSEEMTIGLLLFLAYIAGKAILNVINRLQKIFIKLIIVFKYLLICFAILVIVNFAGKVGLLDKASQYVFYFKEFLKENAIEFNDISPGINEISQENNTSSQVSNQDNYKTYYEGMVQVSESQKGEIDQLKDEIESLKDSIEIVKRQNMNTQVESLGLIDNSFKWTDYE